MNLNKKINKKKKLYEKKKLQARILLFAQSNSFGLEHIQRFRTNKEKYIIKKKNKNSLYVFNYIIFTFSSENPFSDKIILNVE